MIPYAIVFLCTPICAYFLEISIKKEQKIKIFFCFLMTILIPTLVASMRDVSVGVDGTVYVEPLLQTAKNCNFLEFISNTQIEKGFLILIYVISCFSVDVGVAFFFIELITATIMFWAAYRSKRSYSIYFFALIFSMTIFIKSLNLMRQYLAFAFFILSITYLFEHKKKGTIVCFLLAIFFHKIAAIFSIIYLIYIVNLKLKSKKSKIVFFFITVAIFSVILLNIQSITRFLVQTLHIFPEKYYNYFSLIKYDVGYFGIIFRTILVFIMIFITYYRRSSNEFLNNITMLEASTIGLILNWITIFIGEIGEFYRLAYSFLMMGVLYIYPQMIYIIKKDKFNIFFIILVTYAIFLIEWTKFYVLGGEANIYPYIFR